MHKALLAFVASSLLGCIATVGPAHHGPPPGRPPGPPGPPPAEPVREPRVIEGMVIDASTGRPIDRASVDITSPAFRGEMTVQTGPDGRFRTQENPRGEFAIRCRREGYQKFESRAVMSDGIARMDCRLSPLHR